MQRQNSNTFKFFLKSQSANPPPVGRIFNELLSYFITDTQQKAHLIAMLRLLTQNVATEEGNLLQIFVPRSIVDKVAYVSHARAKVWETPIVPSIYDSVKKRHTAIAPILDLYRTQPNSLVSILDSMEARILPRKEYFANPSSGIKILRYSMLDPIKEAAYKKRLEIIARFIATIYRKDKPILPSPDTRSISYAPKTVAPLTLPLNKDVLTENLLQTFKEYKTVNNLWHSGDLYEHSIWTANAIAKWWDEQHFWSI